MSKFGFPLLSAADILTQLRESLNISFVTEDDIIRPKSDTLKLIYTKLLMFTDDRIDSDFSKPSDSAIESHTNDMSTVRLFKTLSTLLSHIGCKDDPFHLSDLFSPDTKRTRYYLSALINYIRFFTEELNVKMDKNEDYVKGKMLSEELNQLSHEKSRLKQEISDLDKFVQDTQHQLHVKTEKISELETEKSRILQERQKINEKMQLLRIEVDGTEASISSLINSLEEATVMQQTLESRVSDSDTHVLLLQEKKAKYQDRRTSEVENSLTEETKNKILKMESIVRKVREASVMLGTLELSSIQYKELTRTLETHKQAKLALQDSCEKLSDSDLNDDAGSKKETGKKNQESHINSFNSSIEAKRAELDYVNKQKHDVLLEITEKQSSLTILLTKKQSLTDTHEQLMQQLKNEHEKTLKKADLYSNKLFQLLQSPEYLKFQSHSLLK